LAIENSDEMCATFTRQNVPGAVKITLKPKMAEELMKKLSEDALTEEFALKIARLPKNQVFNINIEH